MSPKTRGNCRDGTDSSSRTGGDCRTRESAPEPEPEGGMLSKDFVDLEIYGFIFGIKVDDEGPKCDVR